MSDEARTRYTPLWVRTLGFTLVLPGLMVAYAPYFWIIGPERVSALWPPDVSRAPALVIIAVGLVIYVLCATRFGVEGLGTPNPFDPPRRLVTGGLYRWTRNPMYVGVTVTLLGEAWLFVSMSQLAYTAFIAAAFHARVIAYEEPALRRLFGAEFEAYCTRVRRWGLL